MDIVCLVAALFVFMMVCGVGCAFVGIWLGRSIVCLIGGMDHNNIYLNH